MQSWQRPLLKGSLWVLIFSHFSLISGCSGFQPKTDLPDSAVFELRQPLTIPAHQAKQFFQQGQLTTRQTFDRFNQHCRLEVNQLSDQPQTLFPDQFQIIDIRFDEEWIALSRPKAIQLASTQTISAHWFANSDNDSQREESFDLIHLELKPTDKNPNIFRLTCAGALSDGNPQDAPRSLRPKLAQINQILGAYGHIRSADY